MYVRVHPLASNPIWTRYAIRTQGMFFLGGTLGEFAETSLTYLLF